MHELAALTTVRDGDQLHVRLIGEVDLSNAGALEARIMGEIAPHTDQPPVILDLSQLEYLDSAGIGLAHRLFQRLKDSGQAMRISVATGSAVHNLLTLTDLGTLIPVDEAPAG